MEPSESRRPGRSNDREKTNKEEPFVEYEDFQRRMRKLYEKAVERHQSASQDK